MVYPSWPEKNAKCGDVWGGWDDVCAGNVEFQEDAIEVPTLSLEGGGVEKDIADQGDYHATPIEERRRRYRTKLPTITETKCQYHSIRALIASIKDRTHQ